MKLKNNNRVPFNCMVKSETLTLIKSLADHLDRSQGETIDRAVQALAVAESFGGNHLNLKSLSADKIIETHDGQLITVPRSSSKRPMRDDLAGDPTKWRKTSTLDVVGIDQGSKAGKATVETYRRTPRAKGDKNR